MGLKLLSLLIGVAFAGEVHVDMYQDRTNPRKTVVVIEKDGIIETYTVNNKDLETLTLEELLEYGKKKH